MDASLRAGIVGAGFMGGVHARAIRTNGYRLAGVAASSANRSREAAAALDTGAYNDADELIGAADIDVVHICTPNHLHAPLARRALEAGKHVVVEKPVAVSATEAAELVDVWRGTDRVAAVPFAYRFYPTVREARGRLATGAPPHLIHGSYLQDWMSSLGDANWRMNSKVGGPSRAFGDIGVHWCDLAEFVTGQRIASVNAITSTVYDRRGPAGQQSDVDTEDSAVVLFETDAGAQGSVVVSQVSPGRKNRLQLKVDTADAEYAFNQEEPETLWVGGRRENRTWHRGESARCRDVDARILAPAGHPHGYLDSFASFIGDAYATMRGEHREGLPTLADGARATSIVEAVLESAERRDWVGVAR